MVEKHLKEHETLNCLRFTTSFFYFFKLIYNCFQWFER